MNTGQMLFTVGAFALLSTAMIGMYRGISQSNQVVLQSKLGITAISLATSKIEEASGKAFDKATADDVVTALNQLTAKNSLGMETGEHYPDNINDFDDFNNVDQVDSMQQGGKFRIQCRVDYIDPANPNVAQNTATWHKKLTVSVTSPEMRDTVRAYYIFSYWYFR